jgi:hypothetical protein
MKCPNCGLLNPESAQRCDCGYDFLSRSVQRSYLTPKQRSVVAADQDHRRVSFAETISSFAFGVVITAVLIWRAKSRGEYGSHHGLGAFSVVLLFGAVSAAAAVIGAGLTVIRAGRKAGALVCAAGIGGCLVAAAFWLWYR